MKASDLFREIEHGSEAKTAWAEIEPRVRLARNVIRLRQGLGLSQAELAARVGVRQPRIAELESGTANPRLSTVQRVAQALDVDPSALLVPEHDSSSGSAARYGTSPRAGRLVLPLDEFVVYEDAQWDAAFERTRPTRLRTVHPANSPMAASA